MTAVLEDDTELVRPFMDNDGFRRWMADPVFGITYEASGGKVQQADKAGATSRPTVILDPDRAPQGPNPRGEDDGKCSQSLSYTVRLSPAWRTGIRCTTHPHPHAHGPEVAAIVYGLPGPELMAAVKEGRVVHGDCMFWSGDPKWICRACGASFDETRITS